MKKILSVFSITLAIILVLTANTLYASADKGENIIRLNGKNRYESSIEISKHVFPDKVQSLVLVSGENYADALSANGLAAYIDGPILLTEKD